jgi:hypothetical protein
MTAEPEPTDRLRRYLLGTLPAAERDGLEVELLRDDDLFEQLQALEDELVHDLAQDGEAVPALAPFAERMRGNAAGRRRLAAAGLLVDELAGRRATRRRRQPAPIGWLALAAGLLLVAGLAWFVGATRQTGAEGERQATERSESPPTTTTSTAAAAPTSAPAPPLAATSPALAPPPGDGLPPAPAPLVVALALSPGLVRGGEGATRVELTPTVDALRLTLALPAGAPAADRYRVALVDADGIERWSQGGLRPASVAGTSVLRVDVPAAALPEGDYELALAVETAAGSEPVADYAFGVLRAP